MKARLPLLVFIVGLSLGSVLFFPFSVFTTQIEQIVSQQTGLQLQLGDVHMGTGLNLGLGRGGLLALKASRVQMTLPGGRTVVCHDFVASPQLLALVMAQAKISIACGLDRTARLDGTVSFSPAWAPEKLTADVDLTEISLGSLEEMMGLAGYSGQLNGNVQAEVLLAGGRRALPDLSWDVNAKKLQLPAIASPFLSIPSLALGSLNSKGSLVAATGKIDVKELRFGEKSGPLEGQLRGNVTLDKSNGLPTGADIQGSLRTDQEFEMSDLKGINLDLIFGKKKSSGAREFRKVAQGNLFSLLMNPPQE